MAVRDWVLPSTVLILLIWGSSAAHGCGGCYRLPYRSLLQKLESAERVVVARPTDASASAWTVDHAMKGPAPSAGMLRRVDGVSPPKRAQILRWDQVRKSWTVECPATEGLVKFLQGALAVPAATERSSIRQRAENLRYFLPYLEHADAQIADSAHARLAKAPYAVLRELATHLDHDRLVSWITSQRTALKQRGALYVTLLGNSDDARTGALLKQWLGERWSRSDRKYLAALLTAHVEVEGEEAVRFVEASYIQNRDRTLSEIIAAVDALRTHGRASTKVPRDRIKTSFQLLLRERPPLAELVIDDFARWEDWSVASQLMQLHAGGKQPWNNALIAKYLQACPLPAAKQYLQTITH